MKIIPLTLKQCNELIKLDQFKDVWFYNGFFWIAPIKDSSFAGSELPEHPEKYGLPEEHKYFKYGKICKGEFSQFNKNTNILNRDEYIFKYDKPSNIIPANTFFENYTGDIEIEDKEFSISDSDSSDNIRWLLTFEKIIPKIKLDEKTKKELIKSVISKTNEMFAELEIKNIKEFENLDIIINVNVKI